MKITVLLENSSCREDLHAKHGLSLWIETGDQRILFDMGPDDSFARNADRLGIDLGTADLAILSHGHYDHGDGIPCFIGRNDQAPIYAHPDVFGSYWHGKDKYIGLSPEASSCTRLQLTGDEYSLGMSMTLYSCRGWKEMEAIRAYGLTVREEGSFRPDDFTHEQYLLIEEAGKRILISGCSHKGIVNLVHWFHPDVVVGGFHFKSMKDMDKARQAAQYLRDSGAMFYTGHCTGEEAYLCMKEIMGDRLQPLSTGSIIEC